jgi:NAD(P)-dependent dehydrogenase (short-subunit alcohol dehydrogenase family)
MNAFEDTMSNRLANKVCVITGTSGSIGQAAAVAFVREGAIVVGSGHHVGESEETIKAVRDVDSTIAIFEPCDLGSPGACQALVDFAVQSYGRIDVLFNNAADGRILRRFAFGKDVRCPHRKLPSGIRQLQSVETYG